MDRYRVAELAVATAPLYLFPLSFIALREVFIVAMAISTLAMGSSSLAIMINRKGFRGIMVRGDIPLTILSSITAACLLYAVFIAGGYISMRLGLWGYVDAVYISIQRSISADLLPFLLAVIGTMEEIFWRGYIQGYLINRVHGIRSPSSIFISSAYYALAHTPTLNPPLIVGALLVGIVAGYIASRWGVLGSVITHVAWLELIIVYAPASAVLSSAF